MGIGKTVGEETREEFYKPNSKETPIYNAYIKSMTNHVLDLLTTAENFSFSKEFQVKQLEKIFLKHKNRDMLFSEIEELLDTIHLQIHYLKDLDKIDKHVKKKLDKQEKKKTHFLKRFFGMRTSDYLDIDHVETLLLILEKQKHELSQFKGGFSTNSKIHFKEFISLYEQENKEYKHFFRTLMRFIRKRSIKLPDIKILWANNRDRGVKHVRSFNKLLREMYTLTQDGMKRHGFKIGLITPVLLLVYVFTFTSLSRPMKDFVHGAYTYSENAARNLVSFSTNTTDRIKEGTNKLTQFTTSDGDVVEDRISETVKANSVKNIYTQEDFMEKYGKHAIHEDSINVNQIFAKGIGHLPKFDERLDSVRLNKYGGKLVSTKKLLNDRLNSMKDAERLVKSGELVRLDKGEPEEGKTFALSVYAGYFHDLPTALGPYFYHDDPSIVALPIGSKYFARNGKTVVKITYRGKEYYCLVKDLGEFGHNDKTSKYNKYGNMKFAGQKKEYPRAVDVSCAFLKMIGVINNATYEKKINEIKWINNYYKIDPDKFKYSAEEQARSRKKMKLSNKIKLPYGGDIKIEYYGTQDVRDKIEKNRKKSDLEEMQVKIPNIEIKPLETRETTSSFE